MYDAQNAVSVHYSAEMKNLRQKFEVSTQSLLSKLMSSHLDYNKMATHLEEAHASNERMAMVLQQKEIQMQAKTTEIEN